MKKIPTAPLLPNAPPAQDFSKLGFVHITVLGLANQVVPHTGSWRPLATAVKYLVWIAPIVYMAFQAQPPLRESIWTLVWAVTVLGNKSLDSAMTQGICTWLNNAEIF
ncbi:hypothetical protein DSO57_1017462 [Entomophthora muscae]|uniref:Uncharacterized protein n=1 Tax=Entomophthora muscae TaxID=34485 RepID=A0ACC2S6Q1_9FUNG|nr:hypothetical protein DSO57_1017462 [Entomophthora muscae]